MEYSLCNDCMIAAVNDDYTGLQYYLQGPELDNRITAIQVGLERLGFLAYKEDLGFCQSPCDCCNTRLHGDRYSMIGESK